VKNSRREDAAGVAIDAAGVDEEIAGNVRVESERGLRHASMNGKRANVISTRLDGLHGQHRRMACDRE
jgi:hypothetical protein